MEDWLHQRLQHYLRHRLCHAICYCGYPKRSQFPIPFGYLHQSYRRWKVTPRRHPIPDLIKVALEILLEHRQSFPIHPGGATVGFHQLPRRQDKLFGNTVRLCFRHAFLPFQVDPFLKPVGSAPSLHPSYRASSLLRADQPLRSASGLQPSWGPPTWVPPLSSKRQVPMFRMKACARLAPPICRSPSSPYTGSCWTCPRLPNRPGFDDGSVSFDRASAVHFRSPSWHIPDESSSPFPGPFTTWELIPTQRQAV